MGYIPFGALPRLCSYPFTGAQCLGVSPCGLRPDFARSRLPVYNVLECHLVKLLSSIAHNVSCWTISWSIILLSFAPSLLVTVYWCTISWSVTLLSFSPQLLVTSAAGQFLGVLSCGFRLDFARNHGCYTML